VTPSVAAPDDTNPSDATVTVRVLADGQIHRLTDWQTIMQTDFITCPMLYAIAIAMGQCQHNARVRFSCALYFARTGL